MVAPSCPVCTLEDIYQEHANNVCSTCGHEWPMELADDDSNATARVVKDANGNVLSNGDSVTLLKDLKLKGSSTTLKSGTKVKNIRLVDGDHEVDCKVEGMSVMLKACFLKKA